MQERDDELRRRGVREAELRAELLAYNAPHFEHERASRPEILPLPDEPFVEPWRKYVEQSRERGVLPVLAERLVQLRFPVEAGISTTESYLAAVRRGIWPSADQRGLLLNQPEFLQLELFESAAGHVPVIFSSNRDDFRSLLQALAFKNEPRRIPDSQGAAMIAGYSNWDRIRQLREEFEAKPNGESWTVAFERIRGQRELYQDRFVLLGDTYYSGVHPEALGLSPDEWRRKSRIIRLRHECAHYFTRRVLGSMKNVVLDELIADCVGILAAEGTYRASWFLTFMGLERYPEYRDGGRLQNYTGTPPLSEPAFQVLQGLTADAARNLEAALEGRVLPARAAHRDAVVITALSFLTLEELAVPEGVDSIDHAFTRAQDWLGEALQ